MSRARDAGQLLLLNSTQSVHWAERDPSVEACAKVYWASSAELETRLDASFYVIARRPQRLLSYAACPLVSMETSAEVNPIERRLPVELGYLLNDYCLYAQIRDVHAEYWLLGPDLPKLQVTKLPQRAAYKPQPGDLLLPRIYSAIQRTVMVTKTDMPLIVSDAFALVQPRSREEGLVLLALLHHRSLVEQLRALISGTTVRSVTSSKVPSLLVPQLDSSAQADLADRVEELLSLQKTALFMPLSRYWIEGPVTSQQQQSRQLAQQIREQIDHALGIRTRRQQ